MFERLQPANRHIFLHNNYKIKNLLFYLSMSQIIAEAQTLLCKIINIMGKNTTIHDWIDFL